LVTGLCWIIGLPVKPWTTPAIAIFPIRYTGIDLLDWQYKMPCAPSDTTDYLVGDAIVHLRKKLVWDDDVFIFPKSISEFSDCEFQELCDIFGTANYTKNTFALWLMCERMNTTGSRMSPE